MPTTATLTKQTEFSEEQFSMQWVTAAGHALKLRHICKEDSFKFTSFIKNLSSIAHHFRFGSSNYKLSQVDILNLCNPLPNECIHLIIVLREDDEEQIIGSAQYVIQSDRHRCEFSIIVADDWKYHGLGLRLINGLAKLGRVQGIKEMFGRILSTNQEMITFVQELGFSITDSAEGSWLKIATIDLESIC